MNLTGADVERFWRKVDRSTGPDGCWEWQGARNDWGYGQFRAGGKTLSTHRIAFFLTHGYVPERPRMVCHTCDNAPCCNPQHHYDGTAKQNSDDAISRGRANPKAPPSPRLRGEDQGPSKLRNGDVLEMRRLSDTGWSQHRLAVKFGVHRSTVQRVVTGRNWTHVVEDDDAAE